MVLVPRPGPKRKLQALAADMARLVLAEEEESKASSPKPERNTLSSKGTATQKPRRLSDRIESPEKRRKKAVLLSAADAQKRERSAKSLAREASVDRVQANLKVRKEIVKVARRGVAVVQKGPSRLLDAASPSTPSQDAPVRRSEPSEISKEKSRISKEGSAKERHSVVPMTNQQCMDAIRQMMDEQTEWLPADFPGCERSPHSSE